jgi:putative endopeptidase
MSVKVYKKKNKTHKNKKNIIEKKFMKSELMCEKMLNVYRPFEQNVEEIFKKNNMDIASLSFNLEKDVVRELNKADKFYKIKPNEDFYSYINEKWIKEIKLEEHLKYLVQIDDFRLVQDKVYRELIALVEKYINDPKTKNTKKAKCIKNVFESFKTFNTLKQTQETAKKLVTYVDELRKSDKNLWLMLGKFNMNETISWSSPFSWSINPDEKNPSIYKCYIEPPIVTLIDIDIYYDDDDDNEVIKQYKNKYRKEFLKYLDDIFSLVFGKNHGFNVKDVFDCEVELLNAMYCENIKNTEEYNVITKEESIKHFNFDWESFCKNIGFKNVPDEFITSNVNYLLCGTKLYIEKWNSNSWRTYWIYIYIREMCRVTRSTWKIYNEFQGKFLRGQQTYIDEYIAPIFGLSYTFNSFLTDQYIDNYANLQELNYVKNMAEDLKIVFIRILKRNKWLNKKTKDYAIEKLESLKMIIGSPYSLREDPLLNYKCNDPWGNICKMSSWRHKKAIKLVGNKVIDIPVIDWSEMPPKMISTQSYVVNAMYTPTENSIYVPLGYIQSPFINLNERGLEYNLAHIGFTIAHEMSHALDDLGSKYDKNGKMIDWWTEEDKKHFRKIQMDIVKQYELYASYDNIKFDAWPSIGEDIADIAGFGICQEYLRDFQLKSKFILPIQELSFMKFFIYFAVQSRQKLSKKSLLYQLKTNPHPLDKYRCNVPLSRSRIFRSIYNVEKGDKMWWHNFSNIWSD